MPLTEIVVAAVICGSVSIAGVPAEPGCPAQEPPARIATLIPSASDDPGVLGPAQADAARQPARILKKEHTTGGVSREAWVKPKMVEKYGPRYADLRRRIY